MIPLQAKVKIMLKNSSIVEGIVEHNVTYIKLRSLHENCYYIIPNLDDILLIKVIQSQPQSQTQPQHSNIQQFQEVKESPTSPLRLKKLAELKTSLLEEEKQIIANKVKSHYIGEVQQTHYQLPDLRKL